MFRLRRRLWKQLTELRVSHWICGYSVHTDQSRRTVICTDPPADADAMDTTEYGGKPMEERAATPLPATAGDGTAGEGTSTSETSMEIIVDGDDNDTKPVITTASTDAPPTPAPVPVQYPQPQQTYPGGFAIDVCFEASKLPLDACARAAGGDEKIRKYLQAVLVIGGTPLVPGMAHALESR